MIDITGDEGASPYRDGVEVELGVLERHQFGESLCRDEGIQITPVTATNSPPSHQVAQSLVPLPQAPLDEMITLSQPYLNPNVPLDTGSRQLPSLRTVNPYWNSQPSSGPGSMVPSPITPISGDGSGIINSIAANGWVGKIALTPYSRPGSRSDLRSVSTSSTSLRGIDSGRW